MAGTRVGRAPAAADADRGVAERDEHQDDDNEQPAAEVDGGMGDTGCDCVHAVDRRGSRWAVSRSLPKLFWASADVRIIMMHLRY